MRIITEETLATAAKRLGQTDRGRKAMAALLAMLEEGGLSLDDENREHFLTLLQGAWENHSGTARDCMRDVLEPEPAGGD